MSESLPSEQTSSTELIAALELLGPIAALWLEHLKGEAISSGGLQTGIGRVLRAKPHEEVRRHALTIVVELLKSKEGRESLGYSMVYPDELCRQGLSAQRQGYLGGRDLLDLVSGRDDMESLQHLVTEAFRELPDLAKEEEFIDLAENIRRVIKRTDKRIDFEIPRRELQKLRSELSSKDYAHLVGLALIEPAHWWLKPLHRSISSEEPANLSNLVRQIISQQQEVSRKIAPESQRVRRGVREQFARSM